MHRVVETGMAPPDGWHPGVVTGREAAAERGHDDCTGRAADLEPKLERSGRLMIITPRTPASLRGRCVKEPLAECCLEDLGRYGFVVIIDHEAHPSSVANVP